MTTIKDPVFLIHSLVSAALKHTMSGLPVIAPIVTDFSSIQQTCQHTFEEYCLQGYDAM
jgi:hypothetical protein